MSQKKSLRKEEHDTSKTTANYRCLTMPPRMPVVNLSKNDRLKITWQKKMPRQLIGKLTSASRVYLLGIKIKNISRGLHLVKHYLISMLR